MESQCGDTLNKDSKIALSFLLRSHFHGNYLVNCYLGLFERPPFMINVLCYVLLYSKTDFFQIMKTICLTKILTSADL